MAATLALNQTAKVMYKMMPTGRVTASAMMEAVEAGRWPTGPRGSTAATTLQQLQRAMATVVWDWAAQEI